MVLQLMWMLLALVLALVLVDLGSPRGILRRNLTERAMLMIPLAMGIILIVSYFFFRPMVALMAEAVESNPDWHCQYADLQAQCNGGMIIGHMIFSILLSIWNMFVAPISIALMAIWRPKEECW